jgi:hypothetical protein
MSSLSLFFYRIYIGEFFYHEREFKNLRNALMEFFFIDLKFYLQYIFREGFYTVLPVLLSLYSLLQYYSFIKTIYDTNYL